MASNNMAFLSISASCLLLSMLSISNLGIISSMVGFLHEQADHVGAYPVDWPNNRVLLHVEPAHLWTDQGHTSNGVAGYGFFLGLFGIYVAWRQRKTQSTPSKTLLALVILLFLAVLFTLSAIIFVFLVTNQTQGQSISSSIARDNIPYPAHKWTPETWFKAVLDLPLANEHQRNKISSRVTNMVVWRWMLIPIFITDVAAFGIAMCNLIKQRKGARQTEFVMNNKSSAF